LQPRCGGDASLPCLERSEKPGAPRHRKPQIRGLRPVIYTKEEAEKLQSEWVERAKKYKARKFDNANQQAIENHLIQGLIAWGDGPGVGAYHKLILEK